MISHVAGRHDIKIAGRPTFLRSPKSSDSPALSRMMTSASLRRSAEIDRIEPSSTLSTHGPSRMPVASMPMMRGSFSFWQSAANARPTRKMSASEVNIISLLRTQKS